MSCGFDADDEADETQSLLPQNIITDYHYRGRGRGSTAPFGRNTDTLVTLPATNPSNHFDKKHLSQSILCCGRPVCCSDYVDSLTKNERVVSLVYGFVRNSYKDLNIGHDVTLLCLRYTGRSGNFHPTQLSTLHELGYGCCGPETECGICISRFATRCRSECSETRCADSFPYVLNIAIYLCLFAKDIAALMIVSHFDCSNSVEDESEFENLDFHDINMWLYVVAISDLAVGCIRCFAVIWIISDNDECACCCSCAMVPFSLVCFVYYIVWIVYGFNMWSEMKAETTCAQMVLSWSIIQIVFEIVVFFSPVFLVLFC